MKDWLKASSLNSPKSHFTVIILVLNYFLETQILPRCPFIMVVSFCLFDQLTFDFVWSFFGVLRQSLIMYYYHPTSDPGRLGLYMFTNRKFNILY